MAKPDEQSFKKAIERNPHLGEYLNEFLKEGNPKPEFYVQLSREMKNMEDINLIYPVGDPIFIHIYKPEGEREPKYIVIEPKFTKTLREKYKAIFKKMLEVIPFQMEPKDSREFKLMLDQMLGEICQIGEEEEKEGIFSKILKKKNIDKVYLTPREYDELRYKFMKDMAGLGALEPFVRDHYIEDIHCIGIGNIYLFHKIFELME
ncbi:MAG: hypothetical protein DRN88_05480, partial [Candidatus Hydrothermarchaeota archaeon]